MTFSSACDISKDKSRKCVSWTIDQNNTTQWPNLLQILGLNLTASFTHLAWLLCGWQQDKLINNDIVSINVALGQLLYESFRLKQWQELSDADTHERRHVLHHQSHSRVQCSHVYSSIITMTLNSWVEAQHGHHSHTDTKINESKQLLKMYYTLDCLHSTTKPSYLLAY